MTTTQANQLKYIYDSMASINANTSGYKIIQVYSFTGQANVSSGSFYMILKLLDTSKTGVCFSGSFSRSVSGENCTITKSGSTYYCEVTDKNNNFKLKCGLATAETANFGEITVY